MKRVFIVLLFASFCFNLFAAKLKVLQDGNFREQPDGKSKVISIIHKDTILYGEPSGENSKWYKVKYNDQTGYFHVSLLEEIEEETYNEYIIYSKEDVIFMVKLMGGAIAFCGILTLLWGYSSRCKKCKKWFAMEKTNKEILDSLGGYETRTRTDVMRDSKGRPSGSIQRKEQVHVTTIYWRQNYKCKFCGRKTHHDGSTSTEG